MFVQIAQMYESRGSQVAHSAKRFFDGNYLARCQVATPLPLVKWVWERTCQGRTVPFRSVLDLGCGDARFALYGAYERYTGVEIDEDNELSSNLPVKAQVLYGCALMMSLQGYDLCIGNPPYVRHHDMDQEWQRGVAGAISELIKMPVDLRANAYLYFMAKALVSTREDGLVALVVPFEWVARPSAEWLRRFIGANRWSVSVYRLPDGIFPRVLTTASLTIIDKSRGDGQWDYYDVTKDFSARKVDGPTCTMHKTLAYSRRNDILYAQRGLSPGSQKIFCLTEGERLYYSLQVGRDVCPCVTSLRNLPSDFKILSSGRFWEYYVSRGARCWLIRSDKESLSKELKAYLDSVDPEKRDTATCRKRAVWYRYKRPDPARLIFSTGFVNRGPQVLENRIGAVHLGSVGGIYGEKRLPYRKIAGYLRNIDFASRIIHHANSLRKIEINQMNSVLQEALGHLT